MNATRLFYVGKGGGIIAHAETEQTESPTIEDKLTFSLINNSTAYKVTARDKTITQITIPDTYRGLPVTEISDNAFTNCTNLVTVHKPLLKDFILISFPLTNRDK